ncbi:hypothetical protein JM18_002598 [Phytophthora kernoviae]|uniref:Uncharacterized protein n=2 Tax=Phytophthora kernoviae TaxID=325452 RepID=A0A8T0M660_9STRA|nr:hypothetical protein G195_003441 [Phytophthora kernoviae 00238/432]KAG2528479.1 hypothetical protein JM16_002806 [Phytophthora kernoviae]KAG2530057.1 hypothetical protein JM18_002598 [Phytophthora kernoviae]
MENQEEKLRFQLTSSMATANPFYRQALQRDIVAQFPVPILNLCIQSLLMLCPHEVGDQEQDGQIVSTSDFDAHPLTSRQTSVLEDTRKISIGIEIACATDNIEAIRLLCFKGYRLLLPLLNLKGSCDGLTFAALMTFYQALQMIPSEKRDIDSHSICARIGFELFRIAQDTNSDIARVSLPLLATSYQEPNDTDKYHFDNSVSNEEDDSLREVMAMFKLTNTMQGQTPSRDISTPATSAVSVASVRGAPAKGAAAPASKDKGQTNTPQATPRTSDNEKGEAEEKLQRLDELLHSAGYHGDDELDKLFGQLVEKTAASSEEELNVFVKGFQEQEAKKKKKKSRLVVEEVLSPEEVEFRANKQEMERRIRDLATVRKQEQAKLTKLSQVYDGLLKSINKSHQALNTTQITWQMLGDSEQKLSSNVDVSTKRSKYLWSSFEVDQCIPTPVQLQSRTL